MDEDEMEMRQWLEKYGWKETCSEGVYENRDGSIVAIIGVNTIFFHNRTKK